MAEGALHGVVGVSPPGVEVEFEVERGKFLRRAGEVVHGGDELVVVLTVFAAFMRGFHEDLAVLADGGDAACDDFVGSDGVVYGDGTEFGDVEELEGAASVGGSDEDLGAVVEFEASFREDGFLGVWLELLFDACADGCELCIEWRGVGWEVVEVLEGEADFGEFFLGVAE